MSADARSDKRSTMIDGRQNDEPWLRLIKSIHQIRIKARLNKREAQKLAIALAVLDKKRKSTRSAPYEKFLTAIRQRSNLVLSLLCAITFGQKGARAIGAADRRNIIIRVQPYLRNNKLSIPALERFISHDTDTSVSTVTTLSGTEFAAIRDNIKFDGAVLSEVNEVFPGALLEAIRRITHAGQIKAAVMMNFPAYGGFEDCLMSLDIYQESAVWLARTLFDATIKKSQAAWQVFTKENRTIEIPAGELRLNGASILAIAETFGPTILDAFQRSRHLRERRAQAKDCIWMTMNEEGGIVNLILNIEQGVGIKDLLFPEQ